MAFFWELKLELHVSNATLTACQTSGEFGCVPGWGLNDGGAEDNAESLSDPDKSCSTNERRKCWFSEKVLTPQLISSTSMNFPTTVLHLQKKPIQIISHQSKNFKRYSPSSYNTASRFGHLIFVHAFRVAENLEKNKQKNVAN